MPLRALAIALEIRSILFLGDVFPRARLGQVERATQSEADTLSACARQAQQQASTPEWSRVTGTHPTIPAAVHLGHGYPTTVPIAMLSHTTSL